MSKKDYYDVLGISKGSNESDIKKAYRKLAKEKHPDVGGDENEFKEIAEAYEVLSNPDKKRDYDAYGHKGKPMSQGFGGMNMDDLFRDFGFGGNFSQNRSRPKFGQDLRINIPLTLEEIFNGTNKTIRYNRNGACTSCNSSGGHDITTCSTCQGSGSVVQHVRTPMGIMQSIEICHTCHGQGTTYAVQCNVCQGNGVQRGEQEVSIDIPAGIHDGNMLQYNGMGNAIKNGSAGKLIVNITEVGHKLYVRQGNDLKYTLKLKYPQLVLGDKVEIPTIDGTTIKIHIPEYSKGGDNLRINNKGMKQINGNGRGDMYIVLDVDFPKKINEEERELLNKLKNIEETVAKN
jgi:molecular chaperone DnaJ